MFKANSQWAFVVSQFVDQWYDQRYYTCKQHFCVGDCSSAPGAFCYLWKQFEIFDQKMGQCALRRWAVQTISICENVCNFWSEDGASACWAVQTISIWASCLPQQLISSWTKLCWGQVAVIQWQCKGDVAIWIELGLFAAIIEFPSLTEFVMF